MLISVFTPCNESKRLPDLYKSLKEQTHQNWERSILLNGGAEWTCPEDDPRVIIHKTYQTGKVGPLKKEAASFCTGEWLVEVDCDDLLTPNCLEEIAKVPDEYCMCYSNTVNINWQNGVVTPRSFLKGYGWKYRDFNFLGVPVWEARSADPYPQSISKIWFAPNHVRAYKRKDYWEMGGHDVTLKISDDHDINLRSYLHGKIYHIDKPLYIYRVHGKNTWLQYTGEIQTTMREQHDKYIVPLMQKRSKENGLKCIDLGGAIDCPPGYISVDRHNADVICDLNERRPFEDNSIGLIRANDILEHLKDPIHVMNEMYRVLAHGGIAHIAVPAADGLGGACDPTHVSFWNKRSFRYYTEPGMRKYIEPECNCKFNLVKPVEEKMIYDGVKEVFVTLLAEKGGHRYYGENKRVPFE